jgi:hypothetical protein
MYPASRKFEVKQVDRYCSAASGRRKRLNLGADISAKKANQIEEGKT